MMRRRTAPGRPHSGVRTTYARHESRVGCHACRLPLPTVRSACAPWPPHPISRSQARARAAMARLLPIWLRPAGLATPFRSLFTMHRRFASRLKHIALIAARPARRRTVRALRHHVARTRRLAQARAHAPSSLLRAWLDTLFSALRMKNGPRRFSLRSLLRRSLHRRTALATGATPQRAANRRPRRLATSTGWFAFGAR